MSNDVKLEPCPFCGGEAKLCEYDTSKPYEPFGLVVDHAADCFLSLLVDPEAMAAAWNVRHQPQEREAVLEALDWLRAQRSVHAGGVSVPRSALIAIADLIQRKATLTTPAPAEDDDALIRRIEYILDPAASAKERAARRAHLTNHDLRTILSRLEAAPAVSTDDLWNPPEHAWDGLARQLVMWLDMGDKTPRALFKHLERAGCEIPQWLRDEPELQHLDHVPSKGTRAVIIYRAILSRLRGEG